MKMSHIYNSLCNNTLIGGGKRLEFIDLAKGICILLVISYHADMGRSIYSNKPISDFFFSFRMPLYYLLSGLFLTVKENDYCGFIMKKINRLIIPFLFFSVVSNIFSYFFCTRFHRDYFYSSPIYFLITENEGWLFMNNAIWFLFSLFTTYMLYLGIKRIARDKLIPEIIGIALCGIIGYVLSIYKIDLPCYFDSSLTCMPFVGMGIIIRRKTNLIQKTSNKWLDGGLAVLLLVATYFLADGSNEFYCNNYSCTIWQLYLGGICGALGIIYLSKCVGYIPFINYIGRYSIVLLGVHALYLLLIGHVLVHFGISGIYRSLLSLTFVLVLAVPTIWLLKRYCPKLIAQSDLISLA